MKRFALTIAVLALIILLGALVERLVGWGGVGLAAALGVIAGELGWAKIVKPD